MKEETVLNVLMYVFQKHLQDSLSSEAAFDNLIPLLEEAGFTAPVIYQALDWLSSLFTDAPLASPSNGSFRVFAQEEKDWLDAGCRNFLLMLEAQEILTPLTRELVLQQLLALPRDQITPNLVKLVTLFVLASQPDGRQGLVFASKQFSTVTLDADRLH